MKKVCLICMKPFDGRENVKCCPDCRAEGKLICSQCGRVYTNHHKISMCNTCKNKRSREHEAEKREKRKMEMCADRKQQSLDEKAAAARAAGMSYGRYSAMIRGLLKV